MKKLFVYISILLLISVSASTQTAEDYFRNAKEKYDNNNDSAAVLDLNKAIELNQDFTEAYLYRGNCLYFLGRYKEAITDYEKYLNKYPDSVIVLNNISQSYFELKQYDSAISVVSRAFIINPDYAEGYLCRGMIYCDGLRDYKNALKDFDVAIRMRPDDERAYQFAGFVLFKMYDYKNAVVYFDKALLLEPNDARVYYIRGLSKGFSNDFDGACVDLKKAHDLGFENEVASYKDFCK